MSLASQRMTDFNMKYRLRPEPISSDGSLSSDVSLSTNMEQPYDESLDPDIMNELTDMFNMLELDPNDKADLVAAAEGLLSLRNIDPDTVEVVTSLRDAQTSNIKSLIIRLFTLILRLPIECARLFSTVENMNIIQNNIFNIIKQIIYLIQMIVSIPSRIGALTATIYSQIKYISLGTLVLLIVTTMLYQSPTTRPFMLFIFSVIQYLSGVDVPLVANDFVERLKQLTIQFFGARLVGKIITDAANKFVDRVSTEASTAVKNVLTDENTQRTLSTALASSPVLAAASMRIAGEVTGQLRVLYDDMVSPQLQQIQDTVTGTSDRVEALGIDNAQMTALFKNDYLLLKETLLTIQNGQEINEEQLNEALVLIKRNLQTTDLGRMLNANGVIITHNNLMALLQTAQSAVESALGRNVRGQHMLTNSGGLRTRRKHRKTKTTRKKRKSKRKRRSMKSKKK